LRVSCFFRFHFLTILYWLSLFQADILISLDSFSASFKGYTVQGQRSAVSQHVHLTHPDGSCCKVTYPPQKTTPPPIPGTSACKSWRGRTNRRPPLASFNNILSPCRRTALSRLCSPLWLVGGLPAILQCLRPKANRTPIQRSHN
jgi:hypothetical protein